MQLTIGQAIRVWCIVYPDDSLDNAQRAVAPLAAYRVGRRDGKDVPAPQPTVASASLFAQMDHSSVVAALLKPQNTQSLRAALLATFDAFTGAYLPEAPTSGACPECTAKGSNCHGFLHTTHRYQNVCQCLHMESQHIKPAHRECHVANCACKVFAPNMVDETRNNECACCGHGILTARRLTTLKEDE